MLAFLIDANLSAHMARAFNSIGFQAEYVNDNQELRHQSDEVIFDYAIKSRAVIVTRDIGFANPLRFDLHNLTGIVLIRFPNQMTMSAITKEIIRLIKDFKEDDFSHKIIIIEPGIVRKRAI